LKTCVGRGNHALVGRVFASFHSSHPPPSSLPLLLLSIITF